jgi:hypothetical protein
LRIYGAATEAKVNYINGMLVVKVGGQMPDWKKHELIMRFREEFGSSVILEVGKGTNISGEATMRTSF